MQFLDEATIYVKAGKGGAGLSHFRREKYVPLGGPDGGDGGKGGSVILKVDTGKLTLLDFKYQPRWIAQDGGQGGTNNRTGKDGEDLIILLPQGTQVFQNGALVCDLDEPTSEFVIAKGGRGGRGNNFFKSPTNRAPEHAQPGEEGEEGTFQLSLKLVAHVGLIGLPNAGKSTLISRLTAAKPKIADYPFTTLTPNLGVVALEGGKSFVIADIPGLIPGASEGKGLGLQFLKHVERTKVLAHLIDISIVSEDIEAGAPRRTLESIEFELAQFSKELSLRPKITVVTKTDSAPEGYDKEKVAKLLGGEVFHISSVTGEGLDELRFALKRMIISE
jgi:GTP-binding protein